MTNKLNDLATLLQSELPENVIYEQFKTDFDQQMINHTVDNRDDFTLLDYAVSENNEEIVNYLLSFPGWNINTGNSRKITPMSLVSYANPLNYKIALRLLHYTTPDTKIYKASTNPLYRIIKTSWNSLDNTTQANQKKLWTFDLINSGFLVTEEIKDIAKQASVYQPWLTMIQDVEPGQTLTYVGTHNPIYDDSDILELFKKEFIKILDHYVEKSESNQNRIAELEKLPTSHIFWNKLYYTPTKNSKPFGESFIFETIRYKLDAVYDIVVNHNLQFKELNPKGQSISKLILEFD